MCRLDKTSHQALDELEKRKKRTASRLILYEDESSDGEIHSFLTLLLIIKRLSSAPSRKKIDSFKHFF